MQSELIHLMLKAVKLFQTLQLDNGVKTVAEMAAERGVPPDLEGAGGRFAETASLTQPQAQPPQDLGQILEGGKDYSIFTGETPTDVPNPLADQFIGGGGDEIIDKVLKGGLTAAQAEALRKLSERPPPQLPRGIAPPRRSGTVAAGGQFGGQPLAQAPLTLAQILGR